MLVCLCHLAEFLVNFDCRIFWQASGTLFLVPMSCALAPLTTLLPGLKDCSTIQQYILPLDLFFTAAFRSDRIHLQSGPRSHITRTLAHIRTGLSGQQDCKAATCIPSNHLHVAWCLSSFCTKAADDVRGHSHSKESAGRACMRVDRNKSPRASQKAGSAWVSCSGVTCFWNLVLEALSAVHHLSLLCAKLAGHQVRPARGQGACC